MTIAERVVQVEQGAPYSCFCELAERPGVSEARLRGVLGLAAATLQRCKVSGCFTLDGSNRLYRLGSLLDAAVAPCWSAARRLE